VGIDSLFELRELPGQLLMGGKELAELHEGADHVNANLDGSRTVQDIGGHDGAVLGEGVGEVFAVRAAPPV